MVMEARKFKTEVLVIMGSHSLVISCYGQNGHPSFYPERERENVGESLSCLFPLFGIFESHYVNQADLEHYL